MLGKAGLLRTEKLDRLDAVKRAGYAYTGLCMLARLKVLGWMGDRHHMFRHCEEAKNITWNLYLFLKTTSSLKDWERRQVELGAPNVNEGYMLFLRQLLV